MFARKIKSTAALLTLTFGMLSIPAAVGHTATSPKPHSQEIYALAEVYGFGNGTSFLFGAGATVICGVVTAGVGGIACGLVAGA